MKNADTASGETLPPSVLSFSGGLYLTPAPEFNLAPSDLFSPGLWPKVSCHSDWAGCVWGVLSQPL